MDLIGFLVQNEMYLALLLVIVLTGYFSYREKKKESDRIISSNESAITEIKKLLKDHVNFDDKVHTEQNEKINKIEIEQAEQNLKISSNKEDILELKEATK